MLKALTVVALTVAAGVGTAPFTANAAVAGETNPLHPGYAHFTAQANVQTGGGSVEIAKNPLTPSYYQWNVATVKGGDVEIVMNNPLQPGFKRS